MRSLFQLTVGLRDPLDVGVMGVLNTSRINHPVSGN